MPDADPEATERAEADPMGLEVLDAVDVGGTWTVTGDGDTAPPVSPTPAAPATSSKLAERPPAPPNKIAPVPPSTPAAPPPRPTPAARQPRAAPAQHQSPDGRWWWDGGGWQPVQPAPAGSGRPGRGRWLVAAAIVAGLAVAVPLAVAAGTFAYRVTGAPVPRAGSAPGHYLADARSTRIEAAAVSRGLRCGTPPSSVASSGSAAVRICQRASGGRVAYVAMAGRDLGHLIAVTAAVGGQPADEQADLALLRAIIDATVAGRNAPADNAWLSAHFDQSGDSQTVVNGVLLRLTVHDPVRSLAIVPAP